MIFNVTDANGKSFSGDSDDLFKIYGDIIQDSKNGNQAVSDSAMPKNRLLVKNDVKFFNSDGQEIDSKKVLADIRSGKSNVIAIDCDIEATHSGKNHNYCVYYEDSMEKDAESFTNPFEKPMLKNHDQYFGEPIGRIKSAYMGPSDLTSERSAIHVKARITDQDAILKFLDGRFNTVSIGGTMGTVTCNVCGKTILKDGKLNFCGHWKGETYKDQLCYWGVRDIEYNELSVVNTPADDFAQTMKVTVITDNDANKDSKSEKKEEQRMDGNENTTNTITDAVNNNVTSDIVDQVLNSGDPKATQQQEDSQQGADNGVAAQSATPIQNDSQDANGEQQATDELTAVKAELETTKASLEEANGKIKSLTDELEKANKELEDSKKSVETLTNENDSLKDKCMMLAIANKKNVVDTIINKEIAAKKLTDADRANRSDELMKLSMKELNGIVATAADNVQKQPREIGIVPNPTLAVDDKNNGETAESTKTTDNNNAKKTVDDFAKEIVGKLIK